MPLKPLRTKQRFDTLKHNPKALYLFCRDVLKAPWPEAEPYILKDTNVAMHYAYYVKQKLWPELEKILYGTKDAKAATEYCTFNNVRWPEAEPFIVKDLDSAIIYLRMIKRAKWPELEQEILKHKDQDNALLYATSLRERVPALEPLFTEPGYIYAYIGDALKQPWPEAEPTLLKDPKLATLYAIDFKPKWPELENIIKNNPKYKHLWDVYTGKRSRFYI